MKIVSGAQTGVDRAALDAALRVGIDVGGWCPEGRIAEDGVIPAKYPVAELPNAGYKQRTRKNVIDSDGTVVIHFGLPTGGTKKTLSYCEIENKPHLLIDAEEVDLEQATYRLSQFIESNSISVLNVAGPRESGEPRAYNYVYH